MIYEAELYTVHCTYDEVIMRDDITMHYVLYTVLYTVTNIYIYIYVYKSDLLCHVVKHKIMEKLINKCICFCENFPNLHILDKLDYRE